jgi:hypothetical protein
MPCHVKLVTSCPYSPSSCYLCNARHFMSCHLVMSCLLCHVMSCYHAMSCHARHVLSLSPLLPALHVMLVMSCHVMCLHVMSCHALSSLVVISPSSCSSCHARHFMSCRYFMSCHVVISCHVMLCQMVTRWLLKVHIDTPFGRPTPGQPKIKRKGL